MRNLTKIFKKNQRKKLGRSNRELVIRLAIKRRIMKKPVYHLVLARRRSRAGCRYDNLGFFEVFKEDNRSFNVFGINRKKIKEALALGATMHLSVYKLFMQ